MSIILEIDINIYNLTFEVKIVKSFDLIISALVDAFMVPIERLNLKSAHSHVVSAIDDRSQALVMARRRRNIIAIDRIQAHVATVVYRKCGRRWYQHVVVR
jgi:hypothetical protein